jgi:hypothetical protein
MVLSLQHGHPLPSRRHQPFLASPDVPAHRAPLYPLSSPCCLYQRCLRNSLRHPLAADSHPLAGRLAHHRPAHRRLPRQYPDDARLLPPPQPLHLADHPPPPHPTPPDLLGLAVHETPIRSLYMGHFYQIEIELNCNSK